MYLSDVLVLIHVFDKSYGKLKVPPKCFKLKLLNLFFQSPAIVPTLRNPWYRNEWLKA